MSEISDNERIARRFGFEAKLQTGGVLGRKYRIWPDFRKDCSAAVELLKCLGGTVGHGINQWFYTPPQWGRGMGKDVLAVEFCDCIVKAALRIIEQEAKS
jgi:hypothetical protein